jgi:hypothetical protein
VGLNGILERLAFEDFVVDNAGRRVREVAIEILVRAGWISSQQAKDATAQRTEKTPRQKCRHA